MNKFLDQTGLAYLWTKIKTWVKGYVSISVNNDIKTITFKPNFPNENGSVSAVIPSKTSQLTNDSKFAVKSDDLASGKLVYIDGNTGELKSSSIDSVTGGADTKNTAGATQVVYNDDDKLYLIGAKTQGNNPQTYTDSHIYFSKPSGALYVGGLSANTVSATNGNFIDINTGSIKLTGSDFSGITYGSMEQTTLQDVLDAKLNSSAKGQANGIASLDSSGKVLSSQLPSYVDDVIEVYARTSGTALGSDWFSTTGATGIALTPEAGKIYVLMADSGNYSANSQFRWSGTSYVKLNDGGVSAMSTSEMDTATNNWL